MQSPSLNYDEETTLTQRINDLAQQRPETNDTPAMQPTTTYEDTVRRAAETVITYLNGIIDTIFDSHADAALYQSMRPQRGMSSTEQPFIQTTGVINTYDETNSQAVHDTISAYLDDQRKDWSTSPAHTTDNQWFRRHNGIASQEQRIILNETINGDDHQYKPWRRTR